MKKRPPERVKKSPYPFKSKSDIVIDDTVECDNCGKIYSEKLKICEKCGCSIAPAITIEPLIEKYEGLIDMGFGNYDKVLEDIKEVKRQRREVKKQAQVDKIQAKQDKYNLKKQRKEENKRKKLQRKRDKQILKEQKRKNKLENKLKKKELKRERKEAKKREEYGLPERERDLLDAMKMNGTFVSPNSEKVEFLSQVEYIKDQRWKEINDYMAKEEAYERELDKDFEHLQIGCQYKEFHERNFGNFDPYDHLAFSLNNERNRVNRKVRD
jgi:Skp family chaperone for outer membrane proteins